MNIRKYFLVVGYILALITSPSLFAGVGGGGGTVPTVDPTPTVSNITATTATLGGNVIDDGGRALTSKGIEWGTSPGSYPNSVTEGSTAIGVFTVDVTGLPAGTTIYFRAWATNPKGTTPSGEGSFTTDSGGSPATVTSPTFSGVTDSTATLGGNVTNDGGSTVTDRGVVWNTSSPAETGGTTVSMGTGTGAFSSLVTGLPAGTLIYFKAYATNSAGTAYSPESSFTTGAPAQLATVEFPSYSNVTFDSATMGGNVTDDGGGAISERGIVWSVNNPPESDGLEVPMGSGVGVFSATVSGLDAGTTIYFKAYAKNSAGTAYSTLSSFPTDAPPSVPTVESPTYSAVTYESATMGGNVTDDGGDAITERGIVWSVNNPPETDGLEVPMGSGLGAFSATVSGLDSSTTIYFKAYAKNSIGTGYSVVNSFPTAAPPSAPTVTSPTHSSVTDISAILGGNVTDDGGAAVVDRGVVWNTASPAEGVGSVTVSMGSGTGVFSALVTGMSASTTIYYKAYATNAIGTTLTTSEGSFTTLNAPEPTIQASNVTFPKVSGKSLQISWTRGNGNGSIVVIRQQATAIADPSDGTDYAPDSVFGVGAEIPNQNFVVYKGAGDSIWVTGLEFNTAYSVAVYEYSNSGTASDYLLGPATGTQTTGLIPMHNADNGAGCTDCHNHGQWLSRNGELKVVCETCHNATGPAAAKLEFDNHLTPGKNPAVDYVDCGSCHEMHMLNAVDTTESEHSIDLVTRNNKSFLRANVDKYVPTAQTPAYLHTDQPLREDPHPDAPLEANTPDRAVEGGDDTSARGYCQVCHSLTNYHRSTDTAGSDQCHDGESGNCGPVETNCGKCHQHNNKFQGVGGSVSCPICHASEMGSIPRAVITAQFDRFSSHIPGGSAVVTQEDCVVCHDQSSHQSGQVIRLYDADDEMVSYVQPTAAASPLASGEGEQFAGACLSCHDGSADSLPASGSDQTQTSPFTGSAAAPIIDAAAWSTAGHNRPSATYPSSPVSCIGDGTNGCHGSGHASDQDKLLAPAVGAKVSTSVFCLNCHDADGPSSVDVEAQFSGLGLDPATGAPTPMNYRTTADDGAPINQRHDVFNTPDSSIYPNYTDGDQDFSGASLACSDCHAPHYDGPGSVADPDTGIPVPDYAVTSVYTDDGSSLDYDAGGGLDPINPEGSAGGFTEPDFIQYCLTCHDGTPPPGVVLPGAMLNIASAYVGDYHGAGAGSGSGTSINKGGTKYPYTTAADDAAGNDPSAHYAAINCTTCHGAHGSDNIFNLRSSITVAGVQMSIGGKGNMPIPARISDPTVYDLPRTLETSRNSGIFIQNDHNWGAWCSFCHDMSAHAGKTEIDACTKGHKHGGGAF